MREKQVIVQWYDTESYPEEEGIYICSCEVEERNFTFKGVLIPCYWSEETGWLLSTNDDDGITIIAWCDLKAYIGGIAK